MIYNNKICAHLCVYACDVNVSVSAPCIIKNLNVNSVKDDLLWRYRPSSPGKLPLARTPPRAASRWTPRAPEAAGLRPPLTGPRACGPPIRPRGTTPRPRPAYPNNTLKLLPHNFRIICVSFNCLFFFLIYLYVFSALYIIQLYTVYQAVVTLKNVVV